MSLEFYTEIQKAAAWDKLMENIKAGEWQIVPVDPSIDMAMAADEKYDRSFEQQYAEALKFAPKYPGLPE